MIQKVKNLVLSKGKNIPCVWEEKKEDGTVVLVCDMNGRRKTPLFMQKESQQQALIPVRTRDIIVTAKKKEKGIEFVIYGIKSINTETLETELIVLNKTNEEYVFEKTLFNKFESIIKAATKKVNSTDTLAHYVAKRQQKNLVENK